jgi:SAM-dependent methyltransferase
MMPSNVMSPMDERRQARLRDWWDRQAPQREAWIQRSRYYYEQLVRFYRVIVPEGRSVLEVGCGTGYLLSRVATSRAKGIDFSPGLIEEARNRHPDMRFEVVDIERQGVPETYDYILLADVVNDLTDVWKAFVHLRQSCHPQTRLVITYFNPLWQPIFQLAGALRLRTPHRDQNWFSPEDLRQMLELNGFDVIREGRRILLPVGIPLLSNWINRYIAPLPVVRHLCCMNYTVAVPRPGTRVERPLLSCSVVIPCLNEKGNIEDAVVRTPAMGRETELIFVDGGSTDGTWEKLEETVKMYRGPLKLRLLRQTGRKGKGQAVREGFAVAGGDVLMILDADLTVQPEDLPKFFQAIQDGHADFVNGSRLVYPLEDEAMRFLNNLGNHFFGRALSAITDQRLMDTLCGTKVLAKDSYRQIQEGRSFFGDFDPFGDFDLIFGATRLNLKIVELPVRYQARSYGSTKIRRFYHGWLLIRMCLYALRKLR